MNRNNIVQSFLLLSLFACILSSCHESNQNIDTTIQYDTAKLEVVHAEWPIEVKETSGLIEIDGSLWTHNDSGSEPHIYKMNQERDDVEKKVIISGVDNQDWEEMCQDSSHVYIAEFGNNLGSRKNLEIYKVSKSDIAKSDTVQVEKIQFHYPEQSVFPDSYEHNFDAEAFLAIGDSLYIYTKNWLNKRCDIYALPKVPGTYAAQWKSSFDTEGVITGATMNTSQDKVVLLGYNFNKLSNTFSPFVWSFSNFEGADIFSGKAKRHNLDVLRQAEAISWTTGSDYWVTAEDQPGGYPSLYKLTLK